MAAKHHRLTYRLEHLEPVRSGQKTCTVRFSAAAARIRKGDRVTLAFGRYDRPVCLEAVACRVTPLDLEPELMRAFTLPESVRNLVDERRFYERPLEPDFDTAPELLEALAASGGDYEALLLEAAERGAEHCVCVWWCLK